MAEKVASTDHQDDLDLVEGIEAVPAILGAIGRLTATGFAAVARVTESR